MRSVEVKSPVVFEQQIDAYVLRYCTWERPLNSVWRTRSSSMLLKNSWRRFIIPIERSEGQEGVFQSSGEVSAGKLTLTPPTPDAS